MFKYFYLIVYALFGISCTTYRYYHSSHEFKQKVYQPVKKGLIELSVHEEVTYSEKPGAITSWSIAHDRGVKNAEGSIKNFCEGDYLIHSVVQKKENMGTKSDTSFHSSYNENKDRYQTNTYGNKSSSKFLNASEMISNIRGDVLSSSRGKRRQMSEGYSAGRDSQNTIGQQDAHTSTRTMPVFRKYTNINFQCKNNNP